MSNKVFLATLFSVLVTTGFSVWGILSGGWQVSELLALYWLQTLIAGFFTFLRMSAAKGVLPLRDGVPVSRASVISTFFFLVACFILPSALALVLIPVISIIPSVTYERVAQLAPGFAIALGVAFISQAYAYLSFIRSEAVLTLSAHEAKGWYFARLLVLFVVVWSAGLFTLSAPVVLGVFVLMQALFDFLTRLTDRLELQGS